MLWHRALLLLLALGVGAAGVLALSARRLGEGERARRAREAACADAVRGLDVRLEEARELLRRLDVSALRELVPPEGKLPGDSQQDAFVELEQLVGHLSLEQAVRTLWVLPAGGGLPRVGFARAPAAPLPLAAPSAPAVVQAALQPGQELALALLPGPPVRLLAARRSVHAPDLALFVELDLTAELEACRAATGGGSCALYGGTERLWPPDPGNAPAAVPARRALPPGGRGTGLQGEQLRGAFRVGPASLDWQLAFRAPLPAGLDPPQMAGLGAAVLTLLLLGAWVLVRRLGPPEEPRQDGLLGMFDAITDVVVVVDRELNVARANRVAKERFGRDIVGRPYAGVFGARSERLPEELAALRHIFFSGEPRQAELENAAGDQVWEVAQDPIFGAELVVEGVVEHARDVTQDRLLRAQLVQSDKLSTLGEMAAGIAHEINNPIGVVSMFAQLLQEEVKEQLGESSSLLEKVQLIEEQAASVGEIVTGLLRFARRSEGEKTRCDLRSAVRRALSILSHQKRARDVTVDEQLDAPLELMGDEGQLAQVVLNLVVNATHAMDGQGRLVIRGRRRGPEDPPPPGRVFGEGDGQPARVEVSVRDTGHGIPPEKLERIFEPFFTTKVAGEGTGLGLSVSFGIIRDHGGCIWVDSREGEGTTFTLDLPGVDTVEPGGSDERQDPGGR